MKTEFEIDLEDDLLERALSLAPEGTSLDSLIEFSLQTWIDIRKQQAASTDSSPE